MPTGLENLDGILEKSRRIIQALDGVPLEDQRNALQENEGQLEDLKDKFFMNTVAAVPATNACLVESEKVLTALDRYKSDAADASLASLKQAMNALAEKIEELVDKAQMRGTTLT